MMDWLGLSTVTQPQAPRLPRAWRYTLRGCAVGVVLGGALSCGGLWWLLSLVR